MKNKKIPNGYELKMNNKTYFFMEGMWCSDDFKLINDHKSVKFTKMASEQIKEHNSSNKIKIGSSYSLNGNNVIYIGDGKFSTGSGFITENIDNITLTEAQDDIPDGYYYTSKNGNTYFKKNGQWFNKQTKKPLNASSSLSLNRAALNQIDAFNSKSPIKIGDTWTSGNNKTFTYVGGDRLISADGKMVPKNMATTIIDKMTSDNKNSEQEPEEQTDSEIPSYQAPEVEPQSGNEEDEPQQTDNTDDSDTSTLDGLASKIKSSPDARKILILLGRGDEISLMAADIMLNGTRQQALAELKSLNNSEE